MKKCIITKEGCFGFLLCLVFLLPLAALAAPGNALTFDGVDDYVSIPTSSIGNPSGSFTVEAWAMLVPGTGNGDNAALLSKHQNDGGSARSGYTIEYDMLNDRISASLGTSVGWSTVTGGVWTENEWHHVAMVYDVSANLLTLYDNGVSQGSATPAAAPVYNNQDLWLGSSAFYGSYFSGALDEARIWSVARSEEQIRAAMHTSLNGDESGLVAYYPSDQTSGARLADETSHGYDGNLLNMGDDAWVVSSAPIDVQGVTVSREGSFNGSWSGGAPDVWTPSDSFSNVAVADIETRLGGGTDVTITTMGGQAPEGDIHLNAGFSWSGSVLRLDAGNDVNINAVMSATGTAGLTVNTGGDVKVDFRYGAPLGFRGRVDLASSTSLIMNNISYTIIRTLGEHGSHTGADLQGMQSGGYYALGADIDASDTSYWQETPELEGFSPVEGISVFDGLGHTVDRLFIHRESGYEVGLFQWYVDVVRNVGMTNSDIFGSAAVGAVVGANTGMVHSSYATGQVRGGNNNAGGLTGSNQGTVKLCSNEAAVSGNNSIGGIAGSNQGAISSCVNLGQTSGVDAVGGVVGYGNASINGSRNRGTVGGNNKVGGLIGEQTGGGSVADVDNLGEISGKDYVGGLIGYGDAAIVSSRNAGLVDGTGGSCGGLAGWLGNVSPVTGSYNTASIDCGGNAGGLVGAGNGPIANSRNEGAVTGNPQVGGLMGWCQSAGSISASHNSGSVSGGWSGGLAGKIDNGCIVDDSYNTGPLSGSDGVGGLAGELVAGGSISNSYNLGPISSTGNSVAGVAAKEEGAVSNCHYNIDTARINDSLAPTKWGLFDAQFQDWLSDKALDIADYSGTLHPNGDYYEIDSVQGLKDLLGFAVNFGDKFRLVADIDLAPAPGLMVPYLDAVEFNGNGHTLSNLSVSPTFGERLGLFGQLRGTAVKNLSVAGAVVNVPNRNSVGGLVGSLEGGGSIENSSFSGSVRGRYYVGGLLGWSDNNDNRVVNSYNLGEVHGDQYTGGLGGKGNFTVSDSHNSGTVTCDGNYCGGLAGYLTNEISRSYNSGAVSGADFAGGLAGYFNYVITDSYNLGAVSGVKYVGGLAGQVVLAYIVGSYNSGDVSGVAHVGGLLGDDFDQSEISDSYNNGSVTAAGAYVGGILGYAFSTQIIRCYNAGAVSGGSMIGALVGSCDAGTEASYWDSETVGSSRCMGCTSGSITGCTPLPTSGMKKLTSFSSWVIDDSPSSGKTWRIYDGDTYPLLRTILTPLTVTADNVERIHDGVSYTDPLANPVYSIPGADASGHLFSLDNPYRSAVEVGLHAPRLFSDQTGYDIGYVDGMLTIVWAAEVTTAPLANITGAGADCGGEVVDDKGDPVTSRGVCWNTAGSPTTSDTCSSDGSGLGSFTSSMTGLIPGTVYHVRAYATNGRGTGYGEERDFTAPMAQPGNALSFNGTNGYVSIADANDLDMTTNYTLEVWFKADSFGAAGVLRGLISKYQASGANGYFLRLTGTDLDFDQMTTSGLNLQTGKWYHVAAVNENGTRHLYVNGVEQALSGTPLTVAANSNTLRLGSDFNGRYFAGSLDEARIWNVARTLYEVRDGMHKGLSGNETGLVAYSKFDHTSGNSLFDSSLKNHTGTLSNMTDADWVASTAPLAEAIAGRANLRGVWDGNPTSLASGRFLVGNATLTTPDFGIFGHDNGADAWQTTDVPGGTVRRLARSWQMELAGGVGGDLVIDTSGLTGIGDGSGLRLLTDGDGSFADATANTGSFTSGLFTVSGQSLADGSSYTLAMATVVSWMVTPSAGSNGSIAPDAPQSVDDNARAIFTIKPVTGYHLVTPVGGTCGGTYTGDPHDSTDGISYTTTEVTADCTVEATFAVNQNTVTPSSGANGSIAPNTQQPADYNAAVTFTIKPQIGYHVLTPVGGTCGGTYMGDPHDSTNGISYTTTGVTADCTVDANFALNTYTLTYTAGSNGTIDGETLQMVNHGASGTAVTAVADSNYHFVNWSDGSIANPRTDSNVTADMTVTANFASDDLALTITATGNGRGEVTSDPAGIDCGSDCSEIYPYPTPVTLTATPDHASVFVGWAGDCAGTEPTCQVTLDQSRAVTAEFRHCFPWPMYLPAITNKPAP